MTILDEIAGRTRIRVEKRRRECPLDDIKSVISKQDRQFCFEKNLKKDGMSFICEIKKASPSKGVIAKTFPYMEIASEYEQAGADAISVLTEPEYFQGDIRYLEEIRKKVNTPLLRKDFTVDEYMIYEAAAAGADAVLLICSLLNSKQLASWIELSHELGMSALVEAHDEAEVHMAVECGAGVIGVNNRNLKTFEVDVTNCLRLRDKVPENVLFVAESGIRTRADISELENGGVDAVLIGETLMRSLDKQKMLLELRGGM